MIVRAPVPCECRRPAGRRYKTQLKHVLDRQAELREHNDEIICITVMLRAVAIERGERLHSPMKTGGAPYSALAWRIDKRVKQLLSVTWELQRAKEMLDAYEHVSHL